MKFKMPPSEAFCFLSLTRPYSWDTLSLGRGKGEGFSLFSSR